MISGQMDAINEMELKKRVMRRVHGVWFWKSMAPMLGVEAVLLLGVAVGVLTQISLRHIMLNALAASSDAVSLVKFFVSNFLVKSLQSRLLLAVYCVFAGFFARDLWQAVKGLRRAGGVLTHLAVLRNSASR